ncbi:EAL domain-containing protein [Sulfurihydrogenibium sp.]|uniref:EAL domain-containing protein n=1 Tax=Sulfurihydrogenibium sp. TaxID=2053621 RepID=UPI003D0E6A9B
MEIENLQNKNFIDEETFTEPSNKAFNKFYTKLLQDFHSEEFFPSYNIIDNLIKKQNRALYAILKSIQENNLEEAYKELQKLAKRHVEIGLNPNILFDFIKYYTELLKENEKILGLEEMTILTLKDLLERTSVEEYIKHSIKSTIDFISNPNSLKMNSRYDEFFKEGILEKLNEFLNAFENVSSNVFSYKESCNNSIVDLKDYTECFTGKLLHGIGFDIMSFDNEKLQTETIALHKTIHSLMSQILNYYKSKEYSKALSIMNSFISNLYKLIYNYGMISIYWNENKEALIYKVLSDENHKNKLSLLVITPSQDVSSNYSVILNELVEVLMNHTSNFDFLFFTISGNNNIYVFLNENIYGYIDKYENLIKDVEKVANDISKKYLDLANKAIFYIYKFEVKDLLDFSSEEVKEIINILKLETKHKFKEEKLPPIVIINIKDRKLELLEKAKQEIELKKLVLEKVKNKDVDLFIQWIYDINLNRKFFETLVRVKKANDYIPAYKFIDILQRENAMTLLDIAVITNIIKNIDKIKALTNEFYMNIYPPSLSNYEVVKLLKELGELCTKNGITLNLELTEYAIATNKEVLEEISKGSFVLALDDFGTGYTNYELVGDLLGRGIVKTLKVDGNIVKRILESKIYKSIIESITIFCRDMDLRIIYEFADSEAIINTLRDITKSLGLAEDKVHLQGFYLHKPSPLEEEYKALKKETKVSKKES